MFTGSLNAPAVAALSTTNPSCAIHVPAPGTGVVALAVWNDRFDAALVSPRLSVTVTRKTYGRLGSRAVCPARVPTNAPSPRWTWSFESGSLTFPACHTTAPPLAAVSRICQVVAWCVSPSASEKAAGSTSMWTSKLLTTCPSVSGSTITGAAGTVSASRLSRNSIRGRGRWFKRR
jgi:hypothetical protein